MIEVDGAFSWKSKTPRPSGLAAQPHASLLEIETAGSQSKRLGRKHHIKLGGIFAKPLIVRANQFLIH